MDGIVYLVGGGPGDPGLITVKGLECVKKADVIIYDNLVSPVILKHADTSAKVIYAGKVGGKPSITQVQINELILKYAKKGKIVVRLKGGDPFLFGRGAEEALFLSQKRIPFEVVPGVTSAISVPAYAGIPLTHRNFASSVAIITGREDPTKEKESVDFSRIAKGADTLVFLMGIHNLGTIANSLIQNGRGKDTPCAVIMKGTTPEQKTVTGTLETIETLSKKEGVKPPAVVVVGDVVKMKGELDWYESKPLFGKRIVVTRARADASELSVSLEEAGADCLEVPMIKFTPPDNPLKLLKVLIKRQGTFDWMVFTSKNSISFLVSGLLSQGEDIRILQGPKIACIGPGTENKVKEYGLKCDFVPSTYTSEKVVEELSKKENLDSKTVLLPRSNIAGDALPEELKKKGAIVTEVVVYKTLPEGTSEGEKVASVFKSGEVDMVTFTSSSTVKNFLNFAKKYKFMGSLKHIYFASIGPVTTKTARIMGLKVSIESKVQTIPGLVSSIVTWGRR